MLDKSDNCRYNIICSLVITANQATEYAVVAELAYALD